MSILDRPRRDSYRRLAPARPPAASQTPASRAVQVGSDRFEQMTQAEQASFLQFEDALQSPTNLRPWCAYLDEVIAGSVNCRLHWLEYSLGTSPKAQRVAVALEKIWWPAGQHRSARAVWFNAMILTMFRGEGLTRAYDALSTVRRRGRPFPWSVLRPLRALPYKAMHPAILRVLFDVLQQYRLIAQGFSTAEAAAFKLEELIRRQVRAVVEADPRQRDDPLTRNLVVPTLLFKRPGPAEPTHIPPPGDSLYRPQLIKEVLTSVAKWKPQVNELLKTGAQALGDTRPHLVRKGEKNLNVIREIAASLAAEISTAIPDPRRGAGGPHKSGLQRTPVRDCTAAIISGIYGVEFSAQDVGRALSKRKHLKNQR